MFNGVLEEMSCAQLASEETLDWLQNQGFKWICDPPQLFEKGNENCDELTHKKSFLIRELLR